MTPSSPLLAAREGVARFADDLGVEVPADYGDPAGEERALTSAAGLVDRSARGAVLVAGPDAVRFLHSLLSQEIESIPEGGGAHALLLQPQGKLDTDLRILRTGPEECRLDCEVGRGEALAESLRRWKIRIKAEVTDVTGEWGCLVLRGPQAIAVATVAAPTPPPDVDHVHVPWPGLDGVRMVGAGWPGGVAGVDVVGPVAGLERAWAALVAAGAVPAGLTAYEAARVRAGVPRQGHDIDEKTIPQEAFLELSAVSFTKGCFLGQELVCRIDSRGHVNRFLRLLEILPGNDATPAPGTGIVVGDKEVGTLTTVARSEMGTLALGYMRREVEVPAGVVLSVAGQAVPATASALPERA